MTQAEAGTSLAAQDTAAADADVSMQDAAAAAAGGEPQEEALILSQAGGTGGVRPIPRSLYCTEFLTYLTAYARHKQNPLFAAPEAQRALLVDAGRRATRAAGNNSRAGSEERTDLPALPGGTEEEEEDRREAAERNSRKVAEWEVLGEFRPQVPGPSPSTLNHLNLPAPGNLSTQAAALLAQALALHPVHDHESEGLHGGWWSHCRPFPFLLRLVHTVQMSMPKWEGSLAKSLASTSGMSSLEAKPQGCALLLRYFLAVLEQDLALDFRQRGTWPTTAGQGRWSLSSPPRAQITLSKWKDLGCGKTELVRLLVDTILAASCHAQPTPADAGSSGGSGSSGSSAAPTAPAAAAAARGDVSTPELGGLAGKLLTMMFQLYTAAEMCGCYLLPKGAGVQSSQHDRNMMDETLLALMSTGNNLLSAALQQPPAFRRLMAALPPPAVVRLLCYMTAHKAYNRAGGEQQDPMAKSYSKKGNSLALGGPLLRLYEHYHLTHGKYDVEPTVDAMHVLEYVAKDPRSRHKWAAKCIMETDIGFQSFLDALATAAAQAEALETAAASAASAAANSSSSSSRAKRAKHSEPSGPAATMQQVLLSAAHTADTTLQLLRPLAGLASSGEVPRCSLDQVSELYTALSVGVAVPSQDALAHVKATISRRVAQRLLSAA
ncbi:MAG: hypothetical protein WDW38_005776 [Sanguina aurantia]